MVAALSEHILSIVPTSYRRILYYIEKLADLSGPPFGMDFSSLSEVEAEEIHALYDSLGLSMSLLDMMCRKAMRGWFDEEEMFVWSRLANPFRNSPEAPILDGDTPTRDWSAAISSVEEIAAERRIIGLIDCVLFRPNGIVRVDPSVFAWNGGAIGKFAGTVYEERSFADLPILADMLEEAGCCDAAILSHCRQPGQPHARGCWVVDLLTGRE